MIASNRTFTSNELLAKVARSVLLALATFVILALTLTYCAPARAETVGLHLGSVHLNGKRAADGMRQLTNTNVGIYYSFDESESGRWTTGLFRNSYQRPSAYLARSFTLGEPVPGVLVEAFVGVVTGYDEKTITGETKCVTVKCKKTCTTPRAEFGMTDWAVLPTAGLTARLGSGPIAPRVSWHYKAVHLSVERRF